MKVFTEKMIWEGEEYFSEFFDGRDFSGLSPITQVQALCFLPNGQFVIFEDNKGRFGLPGGSVEPGETLEEALHRELDEEAAIELLDFGPLLYLKNINPPSAPVRETYQVRYWAKVQPSEKPVDDPAGKSIARHVVSEQELIRKLNWGRKLDLYLATAKRLGVLPKGGEG